MLGLWVFVTPSRFGISQLTRQPVARLKWHFGILGNRPLGELSVEEPVTAFRVWDFCKSATCSFFAALTLLGVLSFGARGLGFSQRGLWLKHPKQRGQLIVQTKTGVSCIFCATAKSQSRLLQKVLVAIGAVVE